MRSHIPIFLHSSTAATGITLDAPLNKAVAIVEVALKTSIITTAALFKSYKCKRAGESEVKIVGFLFMGGKDRSQIRSRIKRIKISRIKSASLIADQDEYW